MNHQMKILSALVALAFAAPALAAAPDDFDLGGGVSSYQRFVIYPHLEKGVAAMKRGDRDKALAEFERARELAPQSAGTALYLASAYRRFGQPDRADALLDEQRRYTPEDRKLLQALAERSAARQAAIAPAHATAPEAAVASVPPVQAGQAAASRKPAAAPTVASVPASVLQEARFSRELKEGRFEAAGLRARAIWREQGRDAAVLDSLSYRLMQAGGHASSERLLLEAYPFSGAAPARHDLLLDRLAILAAEQPGLITPAERARLEVPLGTPALRGRQAALLTALKDCPGVIGVLGDLSPEYEADDWTRLGDCYRDNAPGLAQHAYTEAQRRRPDGYAARALAYQAFANRDYATAMASWRSLPHGELTPDELKAAATTALSAGDADAAAAWLAAYDERGGAQDDSYWWLRAQADEKRDPAAARAELERAIALRPDASYYARLAAMQQASGETGAEVASLEQAVALDPDDSGLQSSLGFAYWRNNELENARASLEAARKARPDDAALVQQLVYVNQSLGDNDKARTYARQVIDDLDRSGQADQSDLVADQRFGFRRLHEDLGRRWTFSLDATSGSQATAVANSSQPGANYRSYSQAEAEYRLGDPAIDNGKTIAAYARVFAGSGNRNTALPAYAPMLGVGLRWKPWGDQVIYFSVEEQTPLDHVAGARSDTMLRASASFLNEGRYSDDWHASGSGWLAQNLYLDAAHYLMADRTALVADYRVSYHHKLSEGQTFEPYTHVQSTLVKSSGASDSGSDHDVRVGIGARWNLWQGGNRYDAYPGKISVGIEFQHAVTTYLTDKNSVFLTFSGRW